MTNQTDDGAVNVTETWTLEKIRDGQVYEVVVMGALEGRASACADANANASADGS